MGAGAADAGAGAGAAPAPLPSPIQQCVAWGAAGVSLAVGGRRGVAIADLEAAAAADAGAPTAGGGDGALLGGWGSQPVAAAPTAMAWITAPPRARRLCAGMRSDGGVRGAAAACQGPLHAAAGDAARGGDGALLIVCDAAGRLELRLFGALPVASLDVRGALGAVGAGAVVSCVSADPAGGSVLVVATASGGRAAAAVVDVSRAIAARGPLEAFGSAALGVGRSLRAAMGAVCAMRDVWAGAMLAVTISMASLARILGDHHAEEGGGPPLTAAEGLCVRARPFAVWN